MQLPSPVERRAGPAAAAGARLELLSDIAGGVAYEHAVHGGTAAVSASLRQVFGYEPWRFEVGGLSWWLDRVHPDDRATVEQRLAQHRDGTATRWALEYRVQRHDGSWAIVRDRGRTLSGVDGGPDIAVGVWQDASGTQQLQMQMLHSQRVELVGQLAAGVAHDFNNVLSAIGGFTSILLEDCPPEHPHHEDLAQIEALVARASGLAQNLLGFTRRRDVPRRHFVDVADALARLAPTLRILAGTRIQVVIDASPLDVTVPVDPAMLDQVLLNLAANARDAMPDGGTLHIGLRQSSDPARPRVTLSVRDTGTGMSPEVLGRVFQPFFTTKSERRGTGLGLWLVREIVHGVGGRIELDSAPQRGTTVHLEFPAVDEPPSGDPDPRVRRTTRRDPSQRTCLLIEDEDAVRTVTRRILEHHGFRVIEAEASGQGLHLLASHRREIDVIVTDLHMPGLAGLPLIERLRSEAPEISCLVLTGLVDALRSVPPDPERLDVLSKPCDTPHLVARASQLATATQRRRAAA